MSVAIPHDEWPQEMARWFLEVTGDERMVRVIVMHTMETPERVRIAHSIARDFATRSATEKASAHCCVDDSEIIECVVDQDVAYAAPGVNKDGIHIEMSGSFRQTAEQWGDAYSQAVLDLAADAAAQYALAHDVPCVHLSDDELFEGSRGFIGHDQSARVYRKEAKPEEHLDPGAHFPWEQFMQLVTDKLEARKLQFGVE